MIKVRLIKRKLPSGNITLMLQEYNNGERTSESLEMVLTKKNKRDWKNLIAAAEEIVRKRQTKYYENRHHIKINDTSKESFIDFFHTRLPEKKVGNNWGTYNYFKAWKPNCKMYDVDRLLIEDFAKHLDTIEVLGTRSKANYLRSLMGIIGKALEHNLIEGNPLQGFKVQEHFKPSKKQKQYYKDEAVKKLEDTPCDVDVIKRAFLFSCYTGLRHGDVRMLQWDNLITNSDGSVTLDIIVEKTKQPLKIDKLPNKALAQLGSKDAISPFKGLRKSDNIQNKQMQIWMVQAGVWKKGITYHCSRHTYAVMNLIAGVDVFTLRDRMGHSSVINTEVYARIVKSMQSDADDKLNDYLNTI